MRIGRPIATRAPEIGVGHATETRAPRAGDTFQRTDTASAQSPATLLDELRAAADELHPRTAATGQAAARVYPGVGSGIVCDGRSPPTQPYVLLARDDGPETLRAALGAQAIIIEQGRKHPFASTFAKLGRPAVSVTRGTVHTGAPVTVDATRGIIASGTHSLVPRTTSSRAAAASLQLQTQLGIHCTAEVSSIAMIDKALTLGARGLRVDLDSLLFRQPALDYLRSYLLATDPRLRTKRLEQLLVTVRGEVEGLLAQANGRAVTVAIGSRAPHAFFPSSAAGLAQVAAALELPEGYVTQKIGELGAGSSKLDLRGARWVASDAALHDTLATAVLEACAVVNTGVRLLIPAVTLAGEVAQITQRFEAVRRDVQRDFDTAITVTYGAGIETASGALAAADIAEHVGFVEYGAQELTESVHGISPDDAHRFVPQMVETGVYAHDPFVVLDTESVGKLISVAQHIAGKAPATFPAALRGPQLRDSAACAIARQNGIRELTCRPDDMLDVIASFAREAQSASAAKTDTVLGLLSARTAVARRRVEREQPGATLPRLVHLVQDGVISKDEALRRLSVATLEAFERPAFRPQPRGAAIALGVGAAPGCAVGQLALSPESAAALKSQGIPYVMAVTEVHAADIEAVRSASGVISVRGSKTSHAAMVAANSGVACVMCPSAAVDTASRRVWIGRHELSEHDWVSIDGTKGAIYAGQLERVAPAQSSEFATLMRWADEVSRLDVYANADTPEEVRAAFAAGAKAIGLVRTEHMLFSPSLLAAFRSVILRAPNADDAFAILERLQGNDFRAILEAANGRGVTFRLLDPPLYEFLPQTREETTQLAAQLGMSAEACTSAIEDMQEVDSLLGLRGVRLSVARPELEAMQVRAMAHAYADLVAAGRSPAPLAITVPLVNTGAEMRAARDRILAAIALVEAERSTHIAVKIGAMIETPKAVLDAAAIADAADYFSYGTNDLTQLALGFGRNVASKFVPRLIASGALARDPAATIEPSSVGRLMGVAQSLGSASKPDLVAGVCGAQASDPDSAALAQSLGLTYLSVPPSRLSASRLAAAHAALSSTTPAIFRNFGPNPAEKDFKND